MEGVDDVLVLATDGVVPLRSPVLLVALTGLFDIAGAASAALDRFAPAEHAITIGEIDPDPFYDFTQERPQLEDDDGTLVVRWPENQFDIVRGQGDRDLVVLVGVEPHLAWRTYAGCVHRVADELGCEAVVTIGATADTVPHTRAPVVTGSTNDARLASVLGIGQPTYAGVTGVAGVLQTVFADAGLPAISLRVGIPHYLMNAEHPQAVAALTTHLSHVLNVPVPTDPELDLDAARWRSLHDEVVDNDVQLQFYVRILEQDYDRKAEAAIPSADDLGAQFEQYLDDLRERPDDD